MVNILQVYRSRVLSWICVVDVANSVGCQVDLAVLIVWNLELPGNRLVSVCFLSMPPEIPTHPSYNPTLSWTNKRTSSGK
jgi:hypothetical protein